MLILMKGDFVLKKFFIIFLLFVFYMSNSQTAHAGGNLLAFLPEQQDYYYLNGTLKAVNKNEIWQTQNYEGHIYLPIRTVGELFQFQVQWDSSKQSVILNNAKDSIILTTDSKTALLNQQEQTIEIAPILQNGRILLPIRTIAQLLQINVVFQNGIIYLTEQPFTTELLQSKEVQKIRLALLASNIPTSLTTEKSPSDILGTLGQYTYYLKPYNSQYDALYSFNSITEQEQLLEAHFWDNSMANTRSYMLQSANLFSHGDEKFLAIRRDSINLGNYELFKLESTSLKLLGYLPHGYKTEFFYQNRMYYLAFGSIGGQMPGLYYIPLEQPVTEWNALAADELMILHCYQENQYAYVLAQQLIKQPYQPAAKEPPKIYQINIETNAWEPFMQIVRD